MKTNCPAKCGKIFTSKEFAETHADQSHPDWRIPKSKGWATPYGFIDFAYPVTYERALELSKEMYEKYAPLLSRTQSSAVSESDKEGV